MGNGRSSLALFSLILGVLAILLFWVPIINVITYVSAIVLGIIALIRIKMLNQGGKRFAVTGIILGLLPLAITVLMVLLLIFTGAGLPKLPDRTAMDEPAAGEMGNLSSGEVLSEDDPYFLEKSILRDIPYEVGDFTLYNDTQENPSLSIGTVSYLSAAYVLTGSNRGTFDAQFSIQFVPASQLEELYNSLSSSQGWESQTISGKKVFSNSGSERTYRWPSSSNMWVAVYCRYTVSGDECNELLSYYLNRYPSRD